MTQIEHEEALEASIRRWEKALSHYRKTKQHIAARGARKMLDGLYAERARSRREEVHA